MKTYTQCLVPPITSFYIDPTCCTCKSSCRAQRASITSLTVTSQITWNALFSVPLASFYQLYYNSLEYIIVYYINPCCLQADLHTPAHLEAGCSLQPCVFTCNCMMTVLVGILTASPTVVTWHHRKTNKETVTTNPLCCGIPSLHTSLPCYECQCIFILVFLRALHEINLDKKVQSALEPLALIYVNGLCSHICHFKHGNLVKWIPSNIFEFMECTVLFLPLFSTLVL